MLGDFTSRTKRSLALSWPGVVQMRTPKHDKRQPETSTLLSPVFYSFGVPGERIALLDAKWFAEEEFSAGTEEEQRGFKAEVIAGSVRQETLAHTTVHQSGTSLVLDPVPAPEFSFVGSVDTILWKTIAEAELGGIPEGLLVMRFELL